MEKYRLFIAACIGAAVNGDLIYLHGRGQFSSARGAYNYCKRIGDVAGELGNLQLCCELQGPESLLTFRARENAFLPCILNSIYGMILLYSNFMGLVCLIIICKISNNEFKTIN